MLISHATHYPRFAAKITQIDSMSGPPRTTPCLSFGDGVITTDLHLSWENLRELEYLINTALADYDRKPAPVIESMPMFVGDADA